MRKGKHGFRYFLFLMAVFLCIFSTGLQVRAETEKQEVTVYGSWGNDATQRYFMNTKYETNAVCKGGSWYGQYWNGSRWVTYTSNNQFSSGAHAYSMSAKVTDIPAAAPVWSTDAGKYYMYHGSGSTYYYHVQAEKSAADFLYRYICRWNSTGQEEIFDSMAEKGSATVSIADPVVGYYYTINSSDKNSLNSLSAAKYQESAGIPVDVTQFGSYLHVRARSMGGAVGEEKIIPIVYDGEEIQLSILCGTGISKVTAVGAVSGARIGCSSKKTAVTGRFIPGETIILTETPEENGTFVSWKSNRALSYLSGYSAGNATTRFLMPNNKTSVKAEGKVSYSVTLNEGSNLLSGTINGKEVSSIRAFAGDKITIQISYSNKYQLEGWHASGAAYTLSSDKCIYKNENGTSGNQDDIHTTVYRTLVFTMPEGDVTLDPSALIKTFSLTYAGLTSATPSEIAGGVYEAGTVVTVTDILPERTSFLFGGWSASNGKGYTAGEQIEMTQNLTLYAQWTVESKTIRLHANVPEKASSAVIRSESLTSGSIELKDATREQIEASGIGNFGIVTSVKQQDGTTTVYTGGQYAKITRENCRSVTGINWIYCNDSVAESKKSTSVFYYINRNTYSNLRTVPNIVYDTTTETYYLAGVNTDSFSYRGSGTSADYGAAATLLTGIQINDFPDNTSTADYYYYAAYVPLGTSVKITPDCTTIDLKNATAEQIEKYTDIPGFFTTNLTFIEGTTLNNGQYFCQDNYSQSGFDSYNSVKSLKWIYSGRLGTYSTKTFYYNYNSSSKTVTYGASTANDPFPAGTVMYNQSSSGQGYYVYTGSDGDWTWRKERTFRGWIYVGKTYPVSVPSEWEWVEENSETGEGYWQKEVTDVSGMYLPAARDAFSLTGWHIRNEKDGMTGDYSWCTGASGNGIYYLGKDTDGNSLTLAASVATPEEDSDYADLYAQWMPNKCVVSYQGTNYGGSLTADECRGNVVTDQNKSFSRTYYYDQDYVLEGNPYTKAGYTVNWDLGHILGSGNISAVQEGLRKVENGESVRNFFTNDNSTITVFSSFRSTVTSYNINYISDGNSVYLSTGHRSTDSVTVGENVPELKKKDYIFRGWMPVEYSYEEYEVALNEGIINAENGPWDNGTVLPPFKISDGGTINLYALWEESPEEPEPEFYTIHYEGNGAEFGEMEDQIVCVGSDVSLNPNIFGREQYDFAGWNTESDGTGDAREDGATAGFDAAMGEVVTLYAQWNPAVYQVIYEGNGAEFGEMKSSLFLYDSEETLSPISYMKTGYHTEDSNTWNTDKDGLGQGYAEQDTVTNMAERSSDVIKEVTLYAQWVPNEYTIHYIGNGSTAGSMEDDTKIYGINMKLSSNQFEKEGYSFAGWSMQPKARMMSFADSDSINEDLTTEQGVVIDLYAVWTPNWYELTVDPNEGIWSYADDEGNTVEADKAVVLSLCYSTSRNLQEPVRTGYLFTGWSLTGSGSITKNEDGTYTYTMGSGPATLKAQWKPITYTVNLYPNAPDIAVSQLTYNETEGFEPDSTMEYLTGTFVYDETVLPDTGCYLMEQWINDGKWYTETTCDGMCYSPGDMNLTSEQGGVVNLYLNWKDVVPPEILDETGNIVTTENIVLPWTNQEVVLDYSAEDIGSGIKEILLEKEDGSWNLRKTDSIRKIVYDEGITKYKLTATDNYGNKKIIHITVQIDKTLPATDNEEVYYFASQDTLELTITATDQGGSGLKTFALYEGNALSESDATISLLKSCEHISGNSGSITYTFADDPLKNSMVYTLVSEDVAGNVATTTFSIRSNISLTVDAWKMDKTTVHDDTEILDYKQCGDMYLWIDATLNGYMTEVTYDFCDGLNELGVNDIVHALPGEETVTDSVKVRLTPFMEYDKVYTVTITGKKNGREVSTTINVRYVKLTHLPRVYIRYSSGMAMPKNGGEWLDYDSEVRGQGTWEDSLNIDISRELWIPYNN